MRKIIGTLAAATAALGFLAAPAMAEHHSGEERLAKLIEGRVAGEPRSCITTRPTGNDLTVIDGTALVYKEGGTLWVNRTRTPDAIDSDDVLVVRRFGGSGLCRTDSITLADRLTGMFTGVIFLDDFVPYEKADKKG
ncbi:hypothetical protein [Qipengyuania sediminis]|uniref:hypothetical protein n=1 Tax=Qipengyuania sediminis TaxID=1532023 RepID=UPI00105A2E3E|nr:hypothetical protein [Qipengyuania sediminis]